MFDMGFFELLVVFVIALLVLGPERLPKVARKVGYWSGRARATFNNLRYELEREVHNQDMMEKFRSKAKELGIDEESLSGIANKSLSGFDNESLSELNKNGLSGSDQKNIGGHGEFDPLAENPTPKPIENNILPPKENTDGNTSDHSSAPPKESSQ